MRHRKITRRGGVDLAAEVEARKDSPMTYNELRARREHERRQHVLGQLALGQNRSLEQRERDRQIEAERAPLAPYCSSGGSFNEHCVLGTAGCTLLHDGQPVRSYAERLTAWNAQVKAGQRKIEHQD
jgi:hypothetical protein